MTTPQTQATADADVVKADRRKALVEVFGEEFANTYQGPVMYMDRETLTSPASINLYHRDFKFISKSLQHEYQYRSWKGYNQEMLDRYADIVTKKLSSIETYLRTWVRRFEKMIVDNGHELDTTFFPNPMPVTVPVISGHARSYFKLLKLLDDVYNMGAAASMQGACYSKIRAEAEMRSRKVVRAFSAVLRNEVLVLFREADRLKKQQAERGEQGDGATDASLAQQKQTLDDMASDLKTDGSDRTDPNAIIDAAAASSKAVSTVEGKKPRTPRKAATADAAAA